MLKKFYKHTMNSYTTMYLILKDSISSCLCIFIMSLFHFVDIIVTVAAVAHVAFMDPVYLVAYLDVVACGADEACVADETCVADEA